MNATVTTNTVKILGIDPDFSMCECCGKTNLKKVVVLEFVDNSIKRYGTSCAAQAMNKSVATATAQSEMFDYATLRTNIENHIGLRNNQNIRTLNTLSVGRYSVRLTRDFAPTIEITRFFNGSSKVVETVTVRAIRQGIRNQQRIYDQQDVVNWWAD